MAEFRKCVACALCSSSILPVTARTIIKTNGLCATRYSDKIGFRERSETADIAIELSLQPWRAFRPDGVIMFSDILTPLPALGIEFDVVRGKGPVIASPVRRCGAPCSCSLSHVASPLLDGVFPWSELRPRQAWADSEVCIRLAFPQECVVEMCLSITPQSCRYSFLHSLQPSRVYTCCSLRCSWVLQALKDRWLLCCEHAYWLHCVDLGVSSLLQSGGQLATAALSEAQRLRSQSKAVFRLRLH